MLVLALAALSVPLLAMGSSVHFQEKLSAPGAQLGDKLEWAAAISGDGERIVVGSSYNNAEAAGGSAHIFKWDGIGWSLEDALVAPDGILWDYFGWAVAIDHRGERVAIGSDDGGLGRGSVYIFHRNDTEWLLEQKLHASDGASGNYFGQSVAMTSDGSTVVVGCPYDDDHGADSGAAYMFSRSGRSWSEIEKLTPPDSVAGDNFGDAVAISDTGIVVVGSPFHDDEDSIGGAVYLFQPQNESREVGTKIIAPGSLLGRRFGKSVAISRSGVRIAVGSDADVSEGRPGLGSVYVFGGMNEWAYEEKLVAVNPDFGDRFGKGVAISATGNRIVVGSTFEDGGEHEGVGSGSAYVFELVDSSEPSWNILQKLVPPSVIPEGLFGRSVSISGSGDRFVVGSKVSDDGDPDESGGASYVFNWDLPPTPTPTTSDAPPPTPTKSPTSKTLPPQELDEQPFGAEVGGIGGVVGIAAGALLVAGVSLWGARRILRG